MNLLLQKHFENYGFDEHFFSEYEKNATDELQNLRTLCCELYCVREEKKKIVIYADFDVDGIMSSIVAYAGLSELGFNVSLSVPTPANGYGFRTADVDDICNIYPDVSVILTGDVGISAKSAIDEAHNRGLKVFVTDHHIGVPDGADIVVNPNQTGETYSHNGICGSYVLYKTIELFAQLYEDSAKIKDIQLLKLFAGIATISDSMPLLYENRQLVRDSVAIMQQLYDKEIVDVLPQNGHSIEYVHAFVGIKELLKYFANLRKIKTKSDIDEQFYGFYLVPFLNSCKRMDGDMRGVYDIFFSDYVKPFVDFRNMSCVENGIHYVDALSTERKRLTSYYFETLIHELAAGNTDAAQYMKRGVFITDARSGLLGLLGSKFIAISGQPTLVINANADGSYSGSGRNPSWFDFAAKLQAYDPSIICRGHKEAFGIFFPDKQALDNYVAFAETVYLPAEVMYVLNSCQKSTSVKIGTTEDADFMPDKILVNDFLRELSLYHPYGKGFPEPVFDFYIDTNSDLLDVCYFGGESQHTKLKTPSGIDVLLFNQTLDFQKTKQENMGKNGIIVCRGTFRHDVYNKIDSNAVNFIANEFFSASD